MQIFLSPQHCKEPGVLGAAPTVLGKSRSVVLSLLLHHRPTKPQITGGGEGYISKFVAEIITRNLSHTLKRLSLCHVLQLLDVFSPILVIRSLKNTANNRRSFHLCSQEGKYADKGHNKKADTQFVCFQRSLRKNVLHKGSPWQGLPETIPAGMRLQPFLICCF